MPTSSREDFVNGLLGHRSNFPQDWPRLAPDAIGH